MSDTAIPGGFSALPLPSHLQDRLQRLGFKTPTPIQQKSIPVALEGHDVVGIAQTGTGKTLAFGLPMLSRLADGEVGLVLAPTRELAAQIDDAFRALGARTALLIGGAGYGGQRQQLRNRPQVIVATPGRYLDHAEQGVIPQRRIAIVVLDEADRMFDMGFAPAMRKVLTALPQRKQTLLYSATMPEGIQELSSQFQNQPVQIEIERPGTAAELVKQELVLVPHEDKPNMLRSLLDDHRGTVLVFARTRHGARKLARAVRDMGHPAGELHADRTTAQRREAMDRFRSGADRVLVATDIAARGIDVKNIELVVNYDLPDNPEDYIHRIGRTGRAGASGLAITLLTPEQNRDLRDLERVLRAELPLSERSPLERAIAPVRGGRPHPPRGPRSFGDRPPREPNGRENGNRNSGERVRFTADPPKPASRPEPQAPPVDRSQRTWNRQKPPYNSEAKPPFEPKQGPSKPTPKPNPKAKQQPSQDAPLPPRPTNPWPGSRNAARRRSGGTFTGRRGGGRP